MRTYARAMCAAAGLALAAGCAVPGASRKEGSDTLRVGITADYPPMAFKENGELKGLEVDFARRLGEELGVPVQFVELGWDYQIPSLLNGGTDIIMSGMSITGARKVRVAFSDPYLRTGLMALFRRKDAGKFPSVEAIVNCEGRAGFKKGTTAELFVQSSFPNAFKTAYSLPSDAALHLSRNQLDVFIHDGPAIAWLASQFEADLTLLLAAFTEDDLGWAMRHTDPDLLLRANQALAKWKSDGTLDAAIDRWLPYRRQLREKGLLPAAGQAAPPTR